MAQKLPSETTSGLDDEFYRVLADLSPRGYNKWMRLSEGQKAHAGNTKKHVLTSINLARPWQTEGYMNEAVSITNDSAGA
ncbi:hypothetical protein PG999_010115 [Apiospora kogelbergensis]|uniref:Uncharacterized protein n=1 Tax=Apiospora kogelbergensis TaxID=1337665 RepID=A0AAW0QTY3_9PEZI